MFPSCERCPYEDDRVCPDECPEESLVEEWRPDPVYESQYAYACGYYD